MGKTDTLEWLNKETMPIGWIDNTVDIIESLYICVDYKKIKNKE